MEEKINYKKDKKGITRTVKQTGPVVINGENLGTFENITKNYLDIDGILKLENYYLEQKAGLIQQLGKLMDERKDVEYIDDLSWKDDFVELNKKVDGLLQLVTAKKFNSKSFKQEMQKFGMKLIPLRDFKKAIQVQESIDFTQGNLDKLNQELEDLRICKKA